MIATVLLSLLAGCLSAQPFSEKMLEAECRYYYDNLSAYDEGASECGSVGTAGEYPDGYVEDCVASAYDTIDQLGCDVLGGARRTACLIEEGRCEGYDRDVAADCLDALESETCQIDGYASGAWTPGEVCGEVCG